MPKRSPKIVAPATVTGPSDAAPATSRRKRTVAPVAVPSPAAPRKISIILELLRRPEGAGIAELTAATGWQAHSVRGALSGAIGKKLGLKVSSEKTEQGRVYRLPLETQA